MSSRVQWAENFIQRDEGQHFPALRDRWQKEFGFDSSTRRNSHGFKRGQCIDAELSRQPSSHFSMETAER